MLWAWVILAVVWVVMMFLRYRDQQRFREEFEAAFHHGWDRKMPARDTWWRRWYISCRNALRALMHRLGF
jgi:hypothetical protein